MLDYSFVRSLKTKIYHVPFEFELTSRQFWYFFFTYFSFHLLQLAGLVDCDYYASNEYNYTHFVELSSLKDAQPTGYWVRVPVYVIGPRDGHIILSTTDHPNRSVDFVYEIRKLYNKNNR